VELAPNVLPAARLCRNQSSNRYFTTEAQSSQSWEYFSNQKLFTPRPLALWNTGLQFHRASLRGETSFGSRQSA
jgi:hypothetical protein